MDRFWSTVALFFGAGKSPVAPGTCGTLAALPIFLPLTGDLPLHAAVLAALTILAVPASGHRERLRGAKDPAEVVVDEAVGMGVALFAFPEEPAVPLMLAAFLLFRLFDVWKPFPAKAAQDLPGGWGIVADDVVAGIYANLCTQTAAWILWRIA